MLGEGGGGEKRDRQEQVTHRGRAVPALVLIRHVQPAGVIQKRQRKMTDFYQVKTTRDETEKKVTRKKSRTQSRKRRRKQEQHQKSSGRGRGYKGR